MTSLLQQAIDEVKKLPPQDQDAIAARLLIELSDERAWDESFRETSDIQWQKLAASVRADIAAERTIPLDTILPESES